jgi:phosphotransferase family enzyme
LVPDPDVGVLSRSRATRFIVGSNLRTELSGAGWLYALPRLRYGSVLALGAPSAASLTALTRVSDQVTVVDPSEDSRRRVATLATARGWDGVQAMAADDVSRPQADLLVAPDARVGDRATAVRRWLETAPPDAVAFVGHGQGAATDVGTGATGRSSLSVRLTPGHGEVRSLAPLGDAAMPATLRDLELDAPRFRWSSFKVLRKGRLPDLPFPWRPTDRRATIIAGPDIALGAVPEYLARVASDGGHDLNGWRWAVAARGDYDSQKVLVVLVPPGSSGPTGTVKITRASEHSPRLENEARALQTLAGLDIANGRIPTPWFSGDHAGRAIVGEAFVDGAPFRTRARWDPGCPHLADAVGWLTDLAVATRRDVPATAVREALLDLLARYAGIHGPAAAEVDQLRAIFDRVGDIEEPFPSVFQHGDPGIWNLLVDRGDRTVFLDWEAAEADGLPLWDLFYFFRSYAVGAARKAGTRDPVEGAARHMVDGSPLADRLIEAAAAYRAAVGLPAAAVEPLALGCWVHRSLKEAMRSTPERLGSGTSVRFLRHMLERRTAPTLARLYGGEA